jgi:hypothetical protein
MTKTGIVVIGAVFVFTVIGSMIAGMAIQKSREVDMPTMQVDFEVWCNECGAGLCNVTTVDGTSIKVDPCEKCLAAARDEGHGEGYERGLFMARPVKHIREGTYSGEQGMDRELTGMFLRVQEPDGKWRAKDISDCSEEQVRSAIGNYTDEQKMRTILALAKIIKEIGDELNISREWG